MTGFQSYLARFLGFLVFLFSMAAQAQQVTISHGPPKFLTCEVPPAGGFGGAADGLAATMQAVCVGRGGPNIAGYHIRATLANAAGGGPPGQVIVQNISSAGLSGQTTATSVTCGDNLRPFIQRFTEYFQVPAQDDHASFICCEETQTLVMKAQTVFLPTPPGAKPIVAPSKAAYAFTTPVQHILINARVRNNATLFSGSTYDHDGCNPTAPATRCGKVHCLDTWSRNRVAAPAGAGGFTLGPITKASNTSQ